MSKSKTESNDWAAIGRKNSVRLMGWNAAWVLSMALAAFGPKLMWDFDTSLTVLFVLINLGIGFGMILANKRYLNGLDELHQKIFLDAAVFTLGIGLVCGLSYELFEDIKLIPFEPEISHVIMLMGLTYLLGVILGNRRYR